MFHYPTACDSLFTEGVTMKAGIQFGKPYPMGATLTKDGVNFALFSSRATKVELCLFTEKGKETRITLPAKTGHIYHGFVPNLEAGQRYGYRVYGEHQPEKGIYFNPQKLLIDPYSKKIDGTPCYGTAKEYAHFDVHNQEDNAKFAPKSVVVAPSQFRWGVDKSPHIPWEKTVIYEAHVKGLSQQFPKIKDAGTYKALADKKLIDHLVSLGVTTLELLPIQQHVDEHHLQQRGDVNYWGYNTYSHFAVEPRYAANPDDADNELRRAVKALHAAGIEVILDVVYNHTAEQNREGPLLCQRGIDNPSWYWLNEQGHYYNWSGCGNTIQASHRNITRWILDSLRYWVQEFHIDGFRFDLATQLGREPGFNPYGRFFQALYQDPILASCKLIAEPWDIGDFGYQLGNFAQPFAEWNGRYRDDLRHFWVRQNGDLGTFAQRFAGSSDLFNHDGRLPSAGVNLITAHDGFTLRDLVSYNDKHNEANGENNQDGHNDNISDNHGIEGETADEAIQVARDHTARALLASLILSNGTPMLLAGDEMGNSQQGNNNGYCQDNVLTWLDWSNKDQSLYNYTQSLINYRRAIINKDSWWSDENVTWLNADGEPMTIDNWHDRSRKAMIIQRQTDRLILVNGKRSEETFTLPSGNWQIVLAPSENYQLNKNTVQVTHMGIWILEQQKNEEQTQQDDVSSSASPNVITSKNGEK